MLQLLALSVPSSNDLEGLAFRRTLLPHLDQAYNGGLDVDLADRLHCVYSDGGQWWVAGELLEAIVVARRNALGDEHPDTIVAMGNLALIYWNQGLWNKAEVLQVQVLEMWRRALDDEHPDMLLAMGNLALTYLDQGKWAEAEVLGVQVLERRRRVLGDEHQTQLLPWTIWHQYTRTRGNGRRLRRGHWRCWR
jgi:hypothetical protein